ncbi:hypothetical protein SEPCBS119000_004828 [Sporothrix epigloea]|uniref:Uncharacterized protein n=1 Tax=Sporothrix epigloea TaxID=1892477 RepID=A0ABP0DY64_9PEZI
MRPTGAILPLLASTVGLPAALAAPVPGTGSLYPAWDRLVADAYSRTLQLAHSLSSKATTTLTAESSTSTVVIDNRPFTPSADMAPSAVLATRRPIVTTYLMGLGSHKTRIGSPAAAADPQLRKDRTVLKHAPIHLPNTHNGIEVVLRDKEAETVAEATKTTTVAPDSTGPIISPTIIANEEEWDASETGQKLPPGFVIPPSLLMESKGNRP